MRRIHTQEIVAKTFLSMTPKEDATPNQNGGSRKLKRLATRNKVSRNLAASAMEANGLGSWETDNDQERALRDHYHDPLTLLPANMSPETRKLHQSIFNQAEHGVWLLRKPLRYFMYEVMARAQMLSGAHKHWVVRVPSGTWRVPWAYLVLCVSTYDVGMCTGTIAFCKTSFHDVSMNVLISLTFVVDMLIRSISAFPTAGGTLEIRLPVITKKYAGSWFAIDLLGLLPLEYAVGPYWQWVRFGRWFLRWSTHDDFRSVSSDAPWVHDGMKIVKMSLLVFVVAHSVTCIFLSLVVLDSACGSVEAATGAVEFHNRYDPRNELPVEPSYQDNLTNLYIYYFFATLSTLLGDSGASKSSATRILALFTMLVGQLAFAVVFSEVIITLSNRTRTRDNYAHKMDQVNESMAHTNVPHSLRTRVRRFFEFRWLALMGGSQSSSYVDELPNGLKADLMSSCFSQMLSCVPLFADCHVRVLAQLSLQLSVYVCLPDEVVIKQNCVGQSMYFIQRGLVRVIKEVAEHHKTVIVGSLHAGDYFGEVALVSAAGQRRTCSVISSSVLTLLRLTRQGLAAVTKDEPQLMVQVRKIAIHRRRELGEELRAAESVVKQHLAATKFTQQLKKNREKSFRVSSSADKSAPLEREEHSYKARIITLAAAARHCGRTPAQASSERSGPLERKEHSYKLHIPRVLRFITGGDNAVSPVPLPLSNHSSGSSSNTGLHPSEAMDTASSATAPGAGGQAARLHNEVIDPEAITDGKAQPDPENDTTPIPVAFGDLVEVVKAMSGLQERMQQQLEVLVAENAERRTSEARQQAP